MAKKKEKRLLPGDFQRKIKYDMLDETQKKIKPSQGRFFEFPEDLKGEQFQNREFLVFYFDDEVDYKIVLNHFEIHTKAAVSHPELNTGELIKMVKEIKGGTASGKDGKGTKNKT